MFVRLHSHLLAPLPLAGDAPLACLSCFPGPKGPVCSAPPPLSQHVLGLHPLAPAWLSCVPLTTVSLLQLAQIKSIPFDTCKFLVQLKMKGMKHSERVLRLKAKLAARDAREAERLQSKRVCVIAGVHV
jgi:hypothetical protein